MTNEIAAPPVTWESVLARLDGMIALVSTTPWPDTKITPELGAFEEWRDRFAHLSFPTEEAMLLLVTMGSLTENQDLAFQIWLRLSAAADFVSLMVPSHLFPVPESSVDLIAWGLLKDWWHAAGQRNQWEKLRLACLVRRQPAPSLPSKN